MAGPRFAITSRGGSFGASVDVEKPACNWGIFGKAPRQAAGLSGRA